ncbi:MAG: class I SAM-dependent methyltransferase [Steroidobacteraceae bacterium]
MPSEALIAAMREIERGNDEEWYQRLESRKQQESEFHDKMRDTGQIERVGKDQYEEFFSNHRFYRTASLSRRYFFDWVSRHSPGKVVLDFACGDGDVALRAAEAGADLAIGLDISGVSVLNARKAAEERGFTTRTRFLRADCENTGLPSSSVDVVICAGVLHHLDVQRAFPEIERILAPGGRAIAFEALSYNPLIKLYRNRNAHQRTEWEKAHILSLREVRLASRFFDVGQIRYFHMCSILGVWAPHLLPLLNGVDRVLTRVPILQLMSWMFTFELLSKKKPSQSL